MKLNITSRIGIILALVLVLTLSAMLITLLSQEESLKVEKAKENIHELTSNVKESIKYMMGEGVTDASPLVAKLASSKNILDLQVKEGDVIHPGASSAFDADERKCFESGNPLDKSEQFKNQNVFRTIEPIKAEGNCTQCHNAAQGASLAVVSLRYSMKSTDEFIFSQRVKAAGMLIATILLTFIAIMLFLRKNVILILIQAGAKIKELAGEIQRLTSNMNLLSRGHLDIETGKK